MRTVRVFVIIGVFVNACGEKRETEAPSSSPTVQPASAAAIPAGALKGMPWLIGTFRGTGAAGTTQEAFYERYSLADDSTLVVESFKDSTLTGAIDSTRYEVRHDTLASVGTARYIATGISADSVAFGPLTGVKNGFVWRRGDDSSWTAVIIPAGTAPHRTYQMVRLRK